MKVGCFVLCILMAIGVVESRRRRPKPMRRPQPPRGCAMFHPQQLNELNCQLSMSEASSDDSRRDCSDYKAATCDDAIPCMTSDVMQTLTTVIVWRERGWWRRPRRAICCQLMCESGVTVQYADCSKFPTGGRAGRACRGGLSSPFRCHDNDRRRDCKPSVNRLEPVTVKILCPDRSTVEDYQMCMPQCCACDCYRKYWWWGKTG